MFITKKQFGAALLAAALAFSALGYWINTTFIFIPRAEAREVAEAIKEMVQYIRYLETNCKLI